MSFDIRVNGATGSGKPFIYMQSNCLEQDDFDLPTVIAILPTSPTASGLAEKVNPIAHIGSASVKGMSKAAGMQCARIISMSLDMLVLRGKSGGNIYVACYQKNMVFADTAANLDFPLLRSGSPGRDFLKKLVPVLKETNLNNWGVLAQIAIAFSKYEQIPKSTPPRINIEIKH